jgi:type IV pilus assembly protein PilC
MSEFRCRMAKSSGEVLTVEFNSPSEAELRHRLTEQGYYIYSIKEKGRIASLGVPLRRRRKIKPTDFSVFNQQFVALIHAGLPILKSLELLAQRVRDEQFREILNDVASRVKSGASLSESFEVQGMFSKVYTASLYAGEKSGNLEEVIRRFIDYQKVITQTRSKIKSALTYPAILTVLLVVMVTFILSVVVPKFADFYSGLGAQLPQVTLILIAVSAAVSRHLVTGLILLVGAGIALRAWAKTARGGVYLDSLKLKLPIVGDIWNKFAFSQMSRTLSTLLSGGIPLVNSLEIVADASGNQVIAQAVKSAVTSVKEGQSLSRSLEVSRLAPDLAIEMVQVGETTGSLSEMLRHIADFYDEEVNTRLGRLFTFIEPILLLILASIVAFVLISLYLPIFNLAGNLRA